eukprot:7336485-Prymnesium_polylepis.1
MQKRIEGLEAKLVEDQKCTLFSLASEVQVFDGFHEMPTSSDTPLMHDRQSALEYNPHLVLVGKRAALIIFLEAQSEIRTAMGIVE